MLNLLSLLTNKTTWIVLLVFAFGIFVAYLYVKYPNFRQAIKTLLVVLLCVGIPTSAVYCGYEVNGYYSAEGGIFGQLKTSLGINTGTTLSDTFEISNLNLRLDENGEYTATVTVEYDEDSTTKLKLDSSKNYAVLLNGDITSNITNNHTGDTISIGANYAYSFKNYDNKVVAADTLKIYFVINNSKVECRLSTAGGATARDLWNKYFSKNGMAFKFVETSYSKTLNVSEGEGDVTNYSVLKFYNDDELVATKIIENGSVLSDVPSYSKSGYIFEGWSADGENEFDFSQQLSGNLSFYALLNAQLTTVSAMSWNGLESFNGTRVWTNGVDNYYFDSDNSKLYVLDKETYSWEAMAWNGFSNLDGRYIWTDGSNYYYSCGSNQYVLDFETHTSSKITWGGNVYSADNSIINGRDIWTDGVDIYNSNTRQYVLDKETLSWSEISFSYPYVITSNAFAYNVWFDGENYYNSKGSDQSVLDVENHTWNAISWSGLTSFDGLYVWTDGSNYYYSYGSDQYILDVATYTWKVKTWNGLDSFYGSMVWTDGVNYYYSFGETQYIFS